MLWLIWIVMMVAVPVCAGMTVWIQLNREPNDAPPTAVLPEDRVSA